MIFRASAIRTTHDSCADHSPHGEGTPNDAAPPSTTWHQTNSKTYVHPNQPRSHCHKDLVQFWELAHMASETRREPSRDREDLGPVVGDGDRMLEMRGKFPVASHDAPIVVEHERVVRTDVEHGLDCVDHAGLQLRTR
jgi:hypothetical protein